jgi:hypothetical protein
MAKTALILTGAALGAFVALAAGLGIAAGPADAGYGVDEVAPKTVSNIAKKGDMASVSHSAPKALEVAHIEKVGDDLILRDATGRVVYRSQPAAQTTTVEKNVEVPLLTGYGVAVGRVDAAFQATSN